MLPFIFFARFVEIGIHEFARHIDQSLNDTANRRAIDVNVEDTHENRHTRNLRRLQPRASIHIISNQIPPGGSTWAISDISPIGW